VETCLYAKPLLSDGCCIFACLAVVAQQRVYMPQYNVKNLLSSVRMYCIGGTDHERDRMNAEVKREGMKLDLLYLGKLGEYLDVKQFSSTDFHPRQTQICQTHMTAHHKTINVYRFKNLASRIAYFLS
jgi:hypothetical protein